MCAESAVYSSMTVTLKYLKTTILSYLNSKGGKISFQDFQTLLKDEGFDINILSKNIDVQKDIYLSCIKDLAPACSIFGDVAILNFPLNSLSQNIELDGLLCQDIADFLNRISKELTQDPMTVISDPLNIVQDDIKTILQICSDLYLRNGGKQALGGQNLFDEEDSDTEDEDGDDNIPDFLKG